MCVVCLVERGVNGSVGPQHGTGEGLRNRGGDQIERAHAKAGWSKRAAYGTGPPERAVEAPQRPEQRGQDTRAVGPARAGRPARRRPSRAPRTCRLDA
jgi:hypothetical protein